MADPFLAEIRIFGFNFAPVNWALCNGQLMQIRQSTALFSIVGTYYGGDGVNTYGLPNLQGSATCSTGQGPGLTSRGIGQAFGSANITLQTSEMPSHRHTFLTVTGSNTQQQNNPTAGCYLARTFDQFDFSNSAAPNTTLAPMIGPAGGGQPHANQQPYLVMNFCICLSGIFPPRS